MVFGYTSPPFVVSISAVVEDPSSGGGGGGGGGIYIPTIINFSGLAYPNLRVYILKDGQLASIVTANQYGIFSASLYGLTTNTYNFAIYAEDAKGRKSSIVSFPIFITARTTVNVQNIFLSPTIDTDKKILERGDNLVIFGQSIPNKEVLISAIPGQEYLAKVISSALGTYFYNLNTATLTVGQYRATSKSIFNNQTSLNSNPVYFLVVEKSEKKEEVFCSYLRGDLNCDNHVNLIDFSIMAHWYKKQNFPKKVDLNNDGKISLVDFSIMVFNWTG